MHQQAIPEAMEQKDFNTNLNAGITVFTKSM